MLHKLPEWLHALLLFASDYLVVLRTLCLMRLLTTSEVDIDRRFLLQVLQPLLLLLLLSQIVRVVVFIILAVMSAFKFALRHSCPSFLLLQLGFDLWSAATSNFLRGNLLLLLRRYLVFDIWSCRGFGLFLDRDLPSIGDMTLFFVLLLGMVVDWHCHARLPTRCSMMAWGFMQLGRGPAHRHMGAFNTSRYFKVACCLGDLLLQRVLLFLRSKCRRLKGLKPRYLRLSNLLFFFLRLLHDLVIFFSRQCGSLLEFLSESRELFLFVLKDSGIGGSMLPLIDESDRFTNRLLRSIFLLICQNLFGLSKQRNCLDIFLSFLSLRDNVLFLVKTAVLRSQVAV